jgi:myo-inositol-1(or 4)-monophosphatase
MFDPESLMRHALEALDRAEEILGSKNHFAVSEKDELDIVTSTDLFVERTIRELLETRTPDVPVLGEEEGGDYDADRPVWVLDPIDGTANYARSLPMFGVSLGLMLNGTAQIGAISFPRLRTRYSAVIGHGAFCGSRLLTCSDQRDLRSCVVSVGDFAVSGDLLQTNGPRLSVLRALAGRVARVRMLGSAALDLAWVADGAIDASIMLSNKPWDTAAGVVIAREAGAAVLDVAGAEHHHHSESTVSVAPGVRESILEVLADAGLPDFTGE